MRSFYILGLLAFTLAFASSAVLGQSLSWQSAKFPGGGRDAASTFAIGDKVYVGGGSGKKDFYEFDQASQKWTKLGDLPSAGQSRAFGIAFTIDGKGYIGLGQDSGQQEAVFGDLWQYDPTLNTWTQKANFPGGRRDGSYAFVIGNKAYVGGGADSAFGVWNDFYEYDPSTDKWQALNIPDFGWMLFPGTFTIGNFGYVVAGAGAMSELSSLWKYDPTGDSWQQMADLPGDVREAPLAFALAGHGYAGLGMSDYKVVYNDFHSYDPATDTWTGVISPFKAGLAWSSGVAVGATAFAGFGWDLVSAFNGAMYMGTSATGEVNSEPTSTARIFPNPTIRELRSNDLSTGDRVIVQNELGVTVASLIASGNSVDLGNLPTGRYSISWNANGKARRYSVIKR
jgi:N-acetylneuraminic acid mutarotase